MNNGASSFIGDIARTYNIALFISKQIVFHRLSFYTVFKFVCLFLCLFVPLRLVQLEEFVAMLLSYVMQPGDYMVHIWLWYTAFESSIIMFFLLLSPL